MIGGAVSGGDSGREIGSAGQGVMMGGNELIMRGLTAERRSQGSARRIRRDFPISNATQQSGRGMLMTTFERFAGQELFSDAHRDAFARTHPVATDRLARLRQLVETSPYFNTTDPPDLQARRDMMRAKLSGYMELRPQPCSIATPCPTRLPCAVCAGVASFRQGGGGLEQAISGADALIRDQPEQSLFLEIKGDFLQKAGRAQEAIGPLLQGATAT